jgi:hypothetical protein
MHTLRLRCLALLLCCTPLAASAANITYFLNLPVIEGHEVFGTITTDGAAVPTAADVVDWNITFWSAALKQSFTMTPANGYVAHFVGVTADPSGLTVHGGDMSIVQWDSNQMCTNIFCYGFELFPNAEDGSQVLYVTVGLGPPFEVVGQDHVPAPFATRLPRAKPPVLFRLLHIVTIGLETTPTLAQKVEAAKRYYDVNDASDTCTQLTQLVSDAEAMSAAGAVPPSTITQIVGYANSIKMQIACASCTG